MAADVQQQRHRHASKGCTASIPETSSTSPTCTAVAALPRRCRRTARSTPTVSVIVQGTVKGRVTVATQNRDHHRRKHPLRRATPDSSHARLRPERARARGEERGRRSLLDHGRSRLARVAAALRRDVGAWGNGFASAAEAARPRARAEHACATAASATVDHGGSFSGWFDTRDYSTTTRCTYLPPPWFPTIDPDYKISSFRELPRLGVRRAREAQPSALNRRPDTADRRGVSVLRLRRRASRPRDRELPERRRGPRALAAVDRAPAVGVHGLRRTRSRWRDNIPVVSWLVLRGRCRHCDARHLRPLSRDRAAHGASHRRRASSPSARPPYAALAAGFCVVLVALAAIDLEYRIVPNRIVLPAAAICLVAQTALAPEPRLDRSPHSAPSGFLLAAALVYPQGHGHG